jgi:hypothetical protein
LIGDAVDEEDVTGTTEKEGHITSAKRLCRATRLLGAGEAGEEVVGCVLELAALS